jgi:hypothetical protein
MEAFIMNTRTIWNLFTAAISNDEIIRRSSILLIALVVFLVACGGGGGGGGGWIHFTLYTDIGVGDLNGDNRPDLVVSSSNENGRSRISVLLQSATDNGSFEAGTEYRVALSPESVEIGDLNDDNRPDLLVANYASDSVSVLLQDPAQAGTFQSAVEFGTGQHPDGIAIGDLNGDGLDDIAAGGSYLVLLFNNPANPGGFYTGATLTFQPYFSSVAIADLNGDGRNDLAATGNGVITVFLQDAAPLAPGNFSDASTYTAGLQPTAIAIADLDADGKPDLVVANYGSPSDPDTANLSVLIQEHDPVLLGIFRAAVNYQTGPRSQEVAIGDLNDDGTPDLAVANSEGSVSVLLQSATPGVFLRRSNLNAGQPLGVVIADLNEDGLNDIAVADGGARIYFQNPAAPGTF